MARKASKTDSKRRQQAAAEGRRYLGYYADDDPIWGTAEVGHPWCAACNPDLFDNGQPGPVADGCPAHI